MRIYDAERKDGLADNICGTTRVVAHIKHASLSNFDKMIASLKSMSANVSTVEDLIGQDQPDLALIVSILASAGWNLNDDIFTPSELWKARSTAIHKPMNYMHDGNIILGHIVKSQAVDKFGHEIVLGEGDEIPKDFDIEVAGVLYKALMERETLVKDILEKAKSGDMFVSMECLFPDFAYGFLDPETGETKIVERDESTAFLTKHLRIYRGSGEYNGYRVGRVLKDLVFGGQGFVSEPANPESVIKVAASKVAASNVFENDVSLTDISKGGVNSMDQKEIEAIIAERDEAKAALEKVQAEHNEVKQKLDDLVAQDFETKISAAQAKIDELTKELDGTKETIKAVQDEKVGLQKKLDETVAEANKAKAELEAINKLAMAKERMAKLAELKEIKDEESALAELAEMSPETFEIVLKYAGNSAAQETNQSEDNDNDNKETSEATKVLDDVEVEEEVEITGNADAEDSEKETARALAHVLTRGRHTETEGGE